MTIETYRFNSKKEDESRRNAKKGMIYCKKFVDAKLPFGSFRMNINENIFDAKNIGNPGMIKFNTINKDEIIKINNLLDKSILVDKKIFNNCYYVLIDCTSLPNI